MALTWSALAVGALAVVGLPTAVVLLNRRKRHAGWLFLAIAAALVAVGAIAQS